MPETFGYATKINHYDANDAFEYPDSRLFIIPLDDIQQMCVAVIHFAMMFVGAVGIWTFYFKHDTLRNNLWCPFLLLVGLSTFLVASAFEIANYDYEGDWELAGFPSELIDDRFYFFNFGATCLTALGMSKNGFPMMLRRRPSGKDGCCIIATVVDVFATMFDIILVGALIVSVRLYAAGRTDVSGILSTCAAMAGFVTMLRVYYNFGRNCKTLFGGLGLWAMSMRGIVLISVQKRTGNSSLHAMLGFVFVFCFVPVIVGILAAVELKDMRSDDDDDDDDDDNDEVHEFQRIDQTDTHIVHLEHLMPKII